MGIKVYNQVSEDIVVEKEKTYNQISLNDYVEIFGTLRDEGIVQNGKFEDETWEIFNQVYYRRLKFNIDEVAFLRESQKRNLIYNHSDVINSVKIITLIKIKSESLAPLYSYLLFLIKVINVTSFFNEDKVNQLIRLLECRNDSRSQVKFIFEYIKFFPEICTNKQYIEILEYYRINKKQVIKKNRDLPFFESVFKLSDIMNDLIQYMHQPLRERYFPILLWWKITTIIPLRKTEFLVTPKDCIEYKNNKYYLTVRRTSLKKEKDYLITHSLDDYYLDVVEINKELYLLIEEYLNLVEHYDGVEDFYQNGKLNQIERKFLISYRSYYKLKKSYIRRFVPRYEIFNAANFDTLLENFYKEIVPLFGYDVIPKIKDRNNMIEDNQLEVMKPMDTRHLAVINMIMQGVSPIILKEFCGHDDISSSINYYDHLPTYIRCWTYNLSNKIILFRDGTMDVQSFNNSINHFNNVDIKYKKIFLESKNNNYYECNGGRGKCISNDYYIDCTYVSGICDLGCQYYIPSANNKDVYDRIEMLNDSIDIQVDILKSLIRDNRYIKNLEEQYGNQMNKINTIMNQLASMVANSVELTD